MHCGTSVPQGAQGARNLGRDDHCQCPGGDILASLDDFLAETVEGARAPFAPHSPTPGRAADLVNGLASVQSGCMQCHGRKVALQATSGVPVTLDDLKPGPDGKPSTARSM